MKKNRYIQSISILAMFTFTQPMISSMYEAARAGNVERIQQLLEEGTDKETRNEWGETALHTAARRGHTKVVELLINVKAAIETRDTCGKTALHHAACNNKTEVVRLLIEKGAQKDARDKDGETPLHEAAYQGCKESVKILLEAGADQDALSKLGSTPLHEAACHGYNIIIEMLLRAYADVERNPQRAPLARVFDVYAFHKRNPQRPKLTCGSYTKTIRLLLLMDNSYGKDNFSLRTQELLTKYSFADENLKNTKKRQKEHYDTFLKTFEGYKTELPTVLMDLIIGYYDSFEVRKSLFDEEVSKQGALK